MSFRRSSEQWPILQLTIGAIMTADRRSIKCDQQKCCLSHDTLPSIDVCRVRIGIPKRLGIRLSVDDPQTVAWLYDTDHHIRRNRRTMGENIQQKQYTDDKTWSK